MNIPRDVIPHGNSFSVWGRKKSVAVCFLKFHTPPSQTSCEKMWWKQSSLQDYNFDLIGKTFLNHCSMIHLTLYRSAVSTTICLRCILIYISMTTWNHVYLFVYIWFLFCRLESFASESQLSSNKIWAFRVVFIAFPGLRYLVVAGVFLSSGLLTCVSFRALNNQYFLSHRQCTNPITQSLISITVTLSTPASISLSLTYRSLPRSIINQNHLAILSFWKIFNIQLRIYKLVLSSSVNVHLLI